ncbi:recombinase family protein [Streptomyces sp. NPDC048411]|uniref:recombinase family protein n=1 Tax=Streptomyces sp. NPDC048411 TaxID=3157206 RepID=UPI003453DFB2
MEQPRGVVPATFKAPLRIVGAVRLSRYHDATTSPDVQEGMITHAAGRIGGDFIGWAHDVDVSALKTTPWEREELSYWLERPDEWDVMIWQRLDRAVRSMADMADLGRYAKKHGKRLVFASGPGGDRLELDFTSPMSELIMLILAFAAQLEGQTIMERNQGTAAHLQSMGRWTGGPVPYGFEPVRKVFPDGNEGWWLGEHKETADIRRAAVARGIAGSSYAAITTWLNKSGAITPANHRALLADREADPSSRWMSTTVRSMLLSDIVLGHIVTRDGVTIRNADGSPTLQGDALVDAATQRLLKEKLKERVVPALAAPRRKDAHELLGVLVCYACAANVHSGSRTARDGGRNPVFRCNSGAHPEGVAYPAINKHETLAWVEEQFLKRFARFRRTQSVRVAGVDNRPEIEELRDNLRELGSRMASMRGAAADIIMEQMNGIGDRLAELEKVPIVPAREELVELDTTWADDWHASDAEERRQMMLDLCVRVTVGPPTGWRRPVGERLSFDIVRPDPEADALEEAALQAAP